MAITPAQIQQQQRIRQLEQERKQLLDKLASDKKNSKLLNEVRENKINLRRAGDIFSSMRGRRTSADFKRLAKSEALKKGEALNKAVNQDKINRIEVLAQERALKLANVIQKQRQDDVNSRTLTSFIKSKYNPNQSGSRELVQAQVQINQIRNDLKEEKIDAITAEDKLRKVIGATDSRGETALTRGLGITKSETKFRENLRIKTLENLNSNDYKALTGQSMTPSQLEELKTIEIKKNKNISKTQLKNLGLLVDISSQPLRNPINFGVGITKGLKEIFVDPITTAFNYGRRLRIRAEESTNNPLFKDLKKVASGSISAAKFVKEKPIESAILVGTVATAIGVSISTAYKKNPAETVGKAAAYLFPGTILKGVGKITGTTRLLKAKKFEGSIFQIRQNLNTGISNIKGTVEGDLVNGLKFKSTYNLNYNPKTKVMDGLVITKSKGKVIERQKVELIDKGAFFLDAKNKLKIPKTRLPVTQRKISIKETTITPKDREGIIYKGESLFKDSADILTTTVNIFNNSKKITSRVSEVLKVVDPKTKKIILGISKQISKITKKGKVKKINTGLTAEEARSLEKFLNSIQYDKVILGGIDKRTRLARALGLRKTSPVLKTIEQVVDSKGKVKVIFKEGTLKATAVSVKFNFQLPTFKLTLLRTTPLRASKSANISIVKGQRVQTLKLVKSGQYDKAFIEIPKLKVKLPKSNLQLKKLGVYGLVLQASKSIIAIRKAQVRFNKTKQLKDIAIINKNAKILAQSIKTINIKTIKTLIKSKIKNTIKTNKSLKTPRVPPLRKLKIPKFSTLPKTTTGTRKGYIIKIKSGNKVLAVTNNLLPKRRAVNLGREIVDGKIGNYPLSSSFSISAKGQTKISDVTSLKLNQKFRIKKSKNKKVQEQVEKKKFRLDTKKEKDKFKSTLKPRKKVKTKTKTKSKTKKKKASVSRKK